jgi:putative transposase
MVHFMRNLLARVPKTAAAMVAATVRTIFPQPDRASAQRQLREVAKTLQARFPQAVGLLKGTEEEIFTFYDFPTEQRRQIYSTNPSEQLNKELKRRSLVPSCGGLQHGEARATGLGPRDLVQPVDEL